MKRSSALFAALFAASVLCTGCGGGQESVPVADGPSVNKLPPPNTAAGKGARAFQQKHGGDHGADNGAKATR